MYTSSRFRNAAKIAFVIAEVTKAAFLWTLNKHHPTTCLVGHWLGMAHKDIEFQLPWSLSL